MTEFLPVPAPDSQVAAQVAAVLGSHPRGASFGRLGEAAAWLAGCQGQAPARALERPRAVIFVGTHGIAQRGWEGESGDAAGLTDPQYLTGLSAFAPEATAQQAQQLRDGVAPAHTLARRAGAGIALVNAPANGAIDREDAASAEAIDAALAAGQAKADEEIDAGADLLLPGDLGVGATTVAAAIMGRLTRTEPVAIVGPGSGITDEMWKTKVSVIRDAMFRTRSMGASVRPHKLLQALGGNDLAAMVGFMAQAAARRTPMLIDSPLTAVAAVLAERLARGTQAWIFAASLTPEPAHALALEELGLKPLLDLRLTTGQATGSLTALQLISSGLELVADEWDSQAARGVIPEAGHDQSPEQN